MLIFNSKKIVVSFCTFLAHMKCFYAKDLSNKKLKYLHIVKIKVKQNQSANRIYAGLKFKTNHPDC